MSVANHKSLFVYEKSAIYISHKRTIMVHLALGENTQKIYIPTNGWEAGSGDMALAAESTADLITINIPVYEWSVVGTYFLLTIDLTDTQLFAGEWEYCLTLPDEAAVITGIMQVTGSTDDAKQYNATKTYKQYGE